MLSLHYRCLAFPKESVAAKIALLGLIGAGLICGRAFAADQTATWTGAGAGVSWIDPANWDSAAFPDNDGMTFDAVIGAGASVELPDTEIAIEALTLQSGASLLVGDPDEFNSGDLLTLAADSEIAGTLQIQDSKLLIGASLTLGGDGEFLLGSETETEAGTIESRNDSDLTVGAGLAIRPVGSGDASGLQRFPTLTNNGVIEAVGDRELFVSGLFGGGGTLQNNNLLRSRDGGLLDLADTDQSGGGEIESPAGARVELDDVTGGVIRGAGEAEIFGALDGVTLAAGLQAEATTATIRNTLTNQTDLVVPSFRTLSVEGDAVLAGSGALELRDDSGIGGGSGLAIGADQTLLVKEEDAEVDIETDVFIDGLLDLQSGTLNVVDAVVTNRNRVRLRSNTTVNGQLENIGATLTVDEGASPGAVVLEDSTLDGAAAALSLNATFRGANQLDISEISFAPATIAGPVTLQGSAEIRGGQVAGDGDTSTTDSLALASSLSATVDGEDLAFGVPVTNNAPVTVDSDDLRFEELLTNEAGITLNGGRLMLEGGIAGGGSINLAGAETALMVPPEMAFDHNVTGAGELEFDAQEAPDETIAVSESPASSLSALFESGTTTFIPEVDMLQRIEMASFATARFEGGLGSIGAFEDTSSSALHIEGDTTIQSFTDSFNRWQGTFSGAGTTTLEGPVAVVDAALDGRTVLANDDVTAGSLDLVNGARFINNSAETLESTGFSGGVITSTDGTGALENRGRILASDNSLRIAAPFKQTDVGVTEENVTFTGGGAIDGDIVSNVATFGQGLEFATADGRDVTYSFAPASRISGEGNVIFDGSDLSGAGSLVATVDGDIELEGDQSALTVRDGAELQVNGAAELEGEGSETMVGSQVSIVDGSAAVFAGGYAVEGEAGRTEVTGGSELTVVGGDDVQLGESVVISDATLALEAPEDPGAQALAASPADEDDSTHEGGKVEASEATLTVGKSARLLAQKVIIASMVISGPAILQVVQGIETKKGSETTLQNGTSVETDEDSENRIEAGTMLRGQENSEESVNMNGNTTIAGPADAGSGLGATSAHYISGDVLGILNIKNDFNIRNSHGDVYGSVNLFKGSNVAMYDTVCNFREKSSFRIGYGSSDAGDSTSSLTGMEGSSASFYGESQLRVDPMGILEASDLSFKDQSRFYNLGSSYIGLGTSFSFQGAYIQNGGSSEASDGAMIAFGSMGDPVASVKGDYTLQYDGGGETILEVTYNQDLGASTINPLRGDHEIGLSPGSATLTADTVALGAELETEIELAGAEPGEGHDFLDVQGALELGGSALELKLLDDFEAEIGEEDTFAVIASSAGLSGSFGNVASGERLETDDGLGSFQVNYGPESDFGPNQVVLSAFERSEDGGGDRPESLALGEILSTSEGVKARIEAEGAAGQEVVLEVSDDLLNWAQAATLALDGDGRLVEDISLEGEGKRVFYRLRLAE